MTTAHRDNTEITLTLATVKAIVAQLSREELLRALEASEVPAEELRPLVTQTLLGAWTDREAAEPDELVNTQ